MVLCDPGITSVLVNSENIRICFKPPTVLLYSHSNFRRINNFVSGGLFYSFVFEILVLCRRHEAINKPLFITYLYDGRLFFPPSFFFLPDLRNHHCRQQLEDVCCCCFKVFVAPTASHPGELPHCQYSSCYASEPLNARPS